MKKQLSMFMLLAALIVPWVTQAQNCTQNVPFTEDFESYAGVAYNATSGRILPTCWTGFTTVANYTPCVVSGTGSYVYTHGGKSMAMTGGSTSTYGMNKYVLLPPMSVPLNQLQLSFWMCTEQSSATYGTLHVGYVTSDDTTTFVSIANYPSSSATVHSGNGTQAAGVGLDVELVLSNVPATATRLAFKWEHSNSSYHTCCIDDVVLDYIPTCPKPLSMSFSNITTSGATVSWIPFGTETLWEIVCDGQSVYSTDTFYTFTGLDGNTIYNVNIRAICGVGDSSYFIHGSFRTACVSISSLPYENDFENEPHYVSGTTPYADAFPNCWTRINDATGTYNYYPYINTSTSYLIHGNKSMYWYHSTTATYSDNQYAVLPPIDPTVYDITDLTLSFYAKTTATASPWPLFIVGVMTNPTDASTFVPVDTITLTSTATLYVVNFATYTGTGNYIAIRCPRPTAARYCSLDDIYLTDDWCDFPTNVSAIPTQESVTLTWEANGGSSFTVYLGQDTINSVTDTFYTFTNLSGNTLYNYGVATECTSSISMFITGNVRTLCAYVDSLPFFENFDAVPGATSTSVAVNNLPPCWNYHNEGTSTSYSGYPIVYNSSTYAHSGSQALRFYTSSTAGTYDDQVAIMPMTDPTDYPVNTLKVNFWLRSNSTNYNSWCVVGVMSNPSDINTFVPVETIYTNSSTTYANHDVMLGTYNGPHGCVAFMFPQPSSGYNQGYIDDVTLDVMPPCPAPANLTVTHATADSIVVAWQAVGSESSWLVSIGNTEYVSNDTIFAFDNLNPSTTYTISVSALCGSDTSSAISTTASTACLYATLPIVENFDGIAGSSATSPVPAGFLPNCWDIYNDGTRTNYQYAPYVYNSSTYAHSGSNCIRFYTYNSSGDSNQYLILPAIDSNDYAIDELQVSFWLRGNSTSSSYHNDVIVGVMTNPLVEASFIPYDTIISTTTTYTYHEINFNNYTGPHGRVTLLFPKPASSSQYEYGYLDDLSFGQIPTCMSVENITTAYTAADSIIISWQPGGSETQWEVVYDSGSYVATDTFFVADNLSPSTEYTFTVRAICGAGDTSYPATYTTRTDCGPITVLPYIEGFESYPAGSSTSPVYEIPCWGRLDNAGQNHFGYVSTRSSWAAGPHTGDKFIYYYIPLTTGTHADWIITILPPVDTTIYPMNTLQTSFWVRMNSATTSSFIEVGVISDVNNDSTFVPVDTIPVAGDVHTLKTAYLSSFTGSGNHIAYKFHRNTEANYFFIDDVTIEQIPDCPPVSNIALAGVDSNLLSVTWTEVGTATSWDVEYGPAGFTLGSGTTTTVTVDTVTLTGLNSNTMYDVYITPVCTSGTAATRMGSFRTANTYVSLPFSCDFENTVQNGLWVLENGSQTNKWYIGSATNNGGTKALYISDNNGTANNYTISSSTVVFAYTDVMLSTAGSYAYSFDWKCQGESTLDYIRAALVPVSETFTAGTALPSGLSATAMPSSWISLDGNGKLNLQGTWQNRSDVVTVTTPGVYHLVFVFRCDGSVGTQPPAAIDNVMLAAVNCERPMNIALNNLTQTSVDVSWEEIGSATSWEYQLGTATPVVVTDTFCSFTALTANTEYTFRVRSICGGGDSSFWMVYTFRTPCGYITVPYTQDFESESTGSSSTGTSFANCWTRLNNGTTYGGYPYISSTSTYNHTVGGTKGLYWYNTTTTGTYGDYQYIILPPVDTTINPVNTLQLTFWAKASSTSYNPSFQIGVMNNPNDTAITVLGHVNIAGNTNWEEFNVVLNNYTGNGQYVAIRALRPSSSWYAYVDDITLEPIPTCPHVTDLTVDMATYDSVQISWSPVGSETEWSVSSDGTTWTSCYDSTYIFTGLTSSTQYTFYVRPVCGAADTGSSQSIIARTTCAAVTLPYSENFDSYTTSTTAATGVQALCWDAILTGTATYTTGSYVPQVYYSTTNAHSGNYSYRLYGMGYHMLPPMPTSLDSLQLTFWDYTTSTSYGLEVGVMEGSNFIPVQVISTPNSTHMQHTVYFATYTGTSRIIAFRNYYTTSTTTYYSYHYLDNVEVDYLPTCAGVMAVNSVGGSTSTIDVDWTDVTTASSWQLRYGLSSSSMTTVNVTSHPYTITGLDTLTAYIVEVRPICSVGDTGAWSLPVTLSTEMCDGAVVASTGASTGTAYYSPVNNFYNYTLSQTIIDSAELAGMGDITAIAYSYAYTSPTVEKTNVTIWLQPTNKTVFASTTDAVVLDTSIAVQVYTGNLNCSQGWNYFAFNAPYIWDGHSNLLVIVDDNSGDYDGSSYVFNTSNCTGYKTLHYYSDSYNPDPMNPSSFSGTKAYLQNRVTMKLVSCNNAVCRTPVVAGITNVDYQGATITVTGSGNNYELSYGTDPSALANTVINTSGVFVLTGLTPDQQYFFEVVQNCDSGLVSSPASGTFTTDELPCFTPDSVEVVATSFSTATLHWISAGSATQWVVEVNGAGNQRFDTVGTNPYTIPNLYADQDYTASVRALCLTGVVESEWSDTIAFHTDACTPVTGVGVNNITSSSATASWQPTNGALGYRVSYGYYDFYEVDATRVELNANTTSYTFTDLLAETHYEFYVQTKCGEGLYSVVTASDRIDFNTAAESQGIYDVESGTLTLFPNPASTSVTLTVSGIDGEVTVEIVDLNGKRISELRTQNSELQIDLSQFAQGAYFVRVTGEHQTAVRKLIVR